MKKTVLKLLSLVLALSVMTALAGCNDEKKASASAETNKIQNSLKTDSAESSVSSENSSKASSSKVNSLIKESSSAKQPAVSSKVQSSQSSKNETSSDSGTGNSVNMENALFIGDSRTIGLAEYSGLKSDFFANVGMSIYNIHKKPVSVPNVGKVSLTELLKNKKYDKIYIMMGINEIGYKLETTVSKYRELVDLVRANEPDAKIFVQANLHVTGQKSQSDKVINNKAIDRLNKELSKIANGKDIFYLDINKVFDDSNGNLAADKTSDNVHIYAKYYKEWADWIVNRTGEILMGV